MKENTFLINKFHRLVNTSILYVLDTTLHFSILTVPRPVMYDKVCAKIREMYGFDMNIAFTQSNGEVSYQVN